MVLVIDGFRIPLWVDNKDEKAQSRNVPGDQITLKPSSRRFEDVETSFASEINRQIWHDESPA